MMKKSRDLEELPPELLSLIFSFLEGKEALKFIFLSGYFYNTIKKSAICSLRYESGLISFKPKLSFDLSLVSTLSRGDLDVGLELGRLSYYKGDALTSLKHLNQFYSLRELKFSYERLLDLNELQILAKVAPNLEVVDIRSVPGLEPKFYNGEKLKNLKSFRIYTYGQGSNKVPDATISSFLAMTPKISHVALLGGFFQESQRMSLDFLNKLENIHSVGLELPHSYGYSNYCLPLIIPGEGKLKELFIDAHDICWKKRLQSYRLELDTFYFSGSYCIEAMSFYGIGQRLKRLYIKPYTKLDSAQTLTELCERCPNIEEFGVMFYAANVEWLVDLAKTKCQRLKLICFGSLVTNCENDIKLLSDLDNIKDIYLFDGLPEGDVDFLTSSGFNVYNGRKDGFNLFTRNPIGDSSWFMWR